MRLPDFTTSVPSRTGAGSDDVPASGGKFVNLLNDKNFKMIFTKEKNKRVLIDMLNRFIPDIHINDLSFLPQQQNPEQKELVSSAFDVNCTTDNGKHIIVEVQYNERKDFLDRVLYYSTWPIAEQVKAGHKKLCPQQGGQRRCTRRRAAVMDEQKRNGACCSVPIINLLSNGY